MPFPAATQELADGIFSPFPELMSFPGIVSQGGSLEIQFSQRNPNAVSLAVPREKVWESAAWGDLSLPPRSLPPRFAKMLFFSGGSSNLFLPQPNCLANQQIWAPLGCPCPWSPCDGLATVFSMAPPASARGLPHKCRGRQPLSLGCEAFHQETAGIISLQRNSIYPQHFHWWALPVGWLPTTQALWSLGRMPDPLQDVFCKVLFAGSF